jgi:hypothetical protein
LNSSEIPVTTNQDKTTDPAETGNSPKRAYIKPAFRHETVFEVMALACGKVGAVAGPCNSNRKLS